MDANWKAVSLIIATLGAFSLRKTVVRAFVNRAAHKFAVDMVNKYGHDVCREAGTKVNNKIKSGEFRPRSIGEVKTAIEFEIIMIESDKF